MKKLICTVVLCLSCFCTVFAQELSGCDLLVDRKYYSDDRKNYVIFQSDGNLVTRTSTDQYIWDSKTNGQGYVRCVMQGDGNLVLYKANGTGAMAISNTYGYQNGKTKLVMQNDKNLVIIASDKIYYGQTIIYAIWSSLTGKISTQAINDFIDDKLTKSFKTRFVILQHPGQQINFEYFLNNTYETTFTLLKNGAVVRFAHSAKQPSGTYSTGVNYTNFDIAWSVVVQDKANPRLDWADDNIQILANENNKQFQLISNISRNGLPKDQNSTINVTKQ